MSVSCYCCAVLVCTFTTPWSEHTHPYSAPHSLSNTSNYKTEFIIQLNNCATLFTYEVKTVKMANYFDLFPILKQTWKWFSKGKIVIDSGFFPLHRQVLNKNHIIP